MSTNTASVPSYRWLLGMSSWVLLAAVPQGYLAWVGFLVIGIVAKRFSWGMLGVFVGAAVLLAQLPIWGQFQPVVTLVVYLAAMLLALWLNPAWLRVMWDRRGARHTAQRSVSRPAKAPQSSGSRSQKSSAQRSPASKPNTQKASAEKTSKAVRTEKSVVDQQSATNSDPDLSASAAARRLAERAGASTAGMLADPPPSESLETVEINEATAAQFATLPGFSRSMAQSAVRMRRRDGRFASIEDFAMRVKLQPHQLVRLRDRLVCAPPPRGPRSFGRRVDY